eukprot:ctg_433.g265
MADARVRWDAERTARRQREASPLENAIARGGTGDAREAVDRVDGDCQSEGPKKFRQSTRWARNGGGIERWENRLRPSRRCNGLLASGKVVESSDRVRDEYGTWATGCIESDSVEKHELHGGRRDCSPPTGLHSAPERRRSSARHAARL